MPIDNHENSKPNRFSSTVELRRLELRVGDVRSKVRSHYARNRDRWIDQEVKRLTGERDKPGGWLSQISQKSADPEIIKDAAAQSIENRHQNRMGRVNTIYDGMIEEIVARDWGRDRSR